MPIETTPPRTQAGENNSASTDARAGIERAFDVIRNHTVHTKGYVLTALKLIEEFGDASDKASLGKLMKEKSQRPSLGTSKPAMKKPKVEKKR